MIAVKLVVLDWCERGVTIRRWHDRFGEDPMRLGACVTISVPVVICRTDGANERVVPIPGSVFVFILVRRTPDGVKDVLALRLRLWGKVRSNRAAVRPHDWLVMFRAPLGRGRQRSSKGNGLEGNTGRFCVSCVADSSFREILLAQWAVLIQIDIQNLTIALLRGRFLCGMISSALFKTDEHRARRKDDRRCFITTRSFGGGVKKFVERLLDDEMRIRRWPTDGLLSRRGKGRMVATQVREPRNPLLRGNREIVAEDSQSRRLETIQELDRNVGD